MSRVTVTGLSTRSRLSRYMAGHFGQRSFWSIFLSICQCLQILPERPLNPEPPSAIFTEEWLHSALELAQRVAILRWGEPFLINHQKVSARALHQYSETYLQQKNTCKYLNRPSYGCLRDHDCEMKRNLHFLSFLCYVKHPARVSEVADSVSA